ncbi:Cytochrome b5 reductase 4 [Nowakowskiella sp. JEL0407]|nr:Cytochrome b5 reductase 4 [Nowakowskiella sp. JEL0407]
MDSKNLDSLLMPPPPPKNSIPTIPALPNFELDVDDEESNRAAINISFSDSDIQYKESNVPKITSTSSSTLSPLSAHLGRPPSASTSNRDVFPMLGGPQRVSSSTAPSVRRKIPLEPGHSALDWARLKQTADLTGGNPRLRRITVAELSQHRTRDDCWMSIQGRVYNVTMYLKFHPGGVGQLMRGAGKDATELFLKVHPWVNAEIMLDKCHIGCGKQTENGSLYCDDTCELREIASNLGSLENYFPRTPPTELTQESLFFSPTSSTGSTPNNSPNLGPSSPPKQIENLSGFSLSFQNRKRSRNPARGVGHGIGAILNPA